MDTHFKRSLIISSSIIVGSVLVAILALFLISQNINSAVSLIVGAKSQIDQRSASIEALATLRQQAVQAAPYQTAMNELLPTQDQLINFNQWAATIAAKYQVVSAVSFQGGAGQPGFSISATGGFNNITEFLNDLQHQSVGFLVNISAFDLVNQGQNYQFTGQGTLSYRS